MTGDQYIQPIFDLTTGNDILQHDKYVEEHITIGGAVVNVFKLLGIHEQGQLVDIAGEGRAISGGDAAANWTSSNVFKSSGCAGWRSKQTGNDVLTSGFIGYDFGPIYNKTDDRNVYGIETYNHKHIATLAIQQGPTSNHRATQARVERSLDGKTWYGVDIITLPDNELLNVINFKGSSASRYWRIRPVAFNGTTDNVSWEVWQLQLMEYEKTSLYNIQDDMGFLESRDRDYAKDSIEIKASYDLLDAQTDVNMFGAMPGNQNLYFHVSFSQCVRRLGRPLVVGDIFEIPSEGQYTSELKKIKKYMEVTDIAWSTEGYTPGWQPTLQRVIAEPMISSQETQDIIQTYKRPDSTGLLDIDNSSVADLTNISHRVQSKADLNAQERGENQYEVAVISDAQVKEYADKGINIAKLGSYQKRLYVEDGLPPNGAKYTEGATFPDSPSDQTYHRITYPATDVPARLFRFSTVKNRWIYCETDRRAQYDILKPSLQSLIKDPDSVTTNDLTKKVNTPVATPVDDNC